MFNNWDPTDLMFQNQMAPGVQQQAPAPNPYLPRPNPAMTGPASTTPPAPAPRTPSPSTQAGITPPGAPGASSAAPAPAAPGVNQQTRAPRNNQHSNTDFGQQSQIAQNNDVYNPANPQGALRAAMRAAGYNPLSANPMVRHLMAAAPGLASAFLMQGAAGAFGQGAESMNAGGGMGKFFGDFLAKALTGGNMAGILRDPLGAAGLRSGDAPAGNSYGTQWSLHETEQNLHRAREAANSADGNVFALNPYAAYLNNMLTEDPNAASGLLSSLLTPGMGAMGRPWAAFVQNQAELGRANINYDDPAQNPLSWLLGRRG